MLLNNKHLLPLVFMFSMSQFAMGMEGRNGKEGALCQHPSQSQKEHYYQTQKGRNNDSSWSGWLRKYIPIQAGAKVMQYVTQNPGKTMTAILAVQTAVVDAYTTVLGPQFQVNQHSLSGGTATSATGLSNGNVVVGWSSSNNFVVARIFNPNGTAITNEFNVSTSSVPGPTPQIVPSVATFSDDNFIFTWGGGNNTILSRIFSPAGAAVTSPLMTNQVISYTSINSPVVAAFTNGNALVGWLADSTGNYVNKARIVSSTGTFINNEFTLCQSSSVSNAPLFTSLDNGNIYAVLSCGTNYGAEVMPNGTVTSNPNQINLACPISSMAITGLPGSNAMAIYTPSSSQILGRIIQNGTPVGNEFVVVNGTTQAELPLLSTLSTGNVLAVWLGLDPQTGLNNYGNMFSPSGTALASPFGIPSDCTGGSASITSLPNGSAFVGWEDPSYHIVYGRQISFVQSSLTSSPTEAPTLVPTMAPTQIPTSRAPASSPVTSTPSSSAMPTSSPTKGKPTSSTMPTPSTTTRVPTSQPSSSDVSAGHSLEPGFLFLPIKGIVGVVNSLATLLNWRSVTAS